MYIGTLRVQENMKNVMFLAIFNPGLSLILDLILEGRILNKEAWVATHLGDLPGPRTIHIHSYINFLIYSVKIFCNKNVFHTMI